MSDRLRFFAAVSDEDLKTCGQCRESKRLGEFVRDRSKRTGYGSICRACDKKKSAAYFRENRAAVLARAAARRPSTLDPLRFCSECPARLQGKQRFVCSPRCAEARFKRTSPEKYAAREAAKVERRRERRREARES